MKEILEKYIQDNYEIIMEKIKGGKLFGEEINEYDIRHLVVSAYLAGAYAKESEIYKYLEVREKI